MQRKRPRRSRLAWATVVASLALGGGVVLQKFLRAPAGPSPQALPPDTNLVIVSIDTLRADHLPSYGYAQVETPVADRLAREGVRFEWAFSPAPLTLPAHCSLFTGLLPFSHGVRDNGGFRLRDAHQTLAEVFKAAGYRTAAFVSAFVLDSSWGIAQGFDHYFDEFEASVADMAAMARVQRPASEATSRARVWLRGRAGEKLFLWLHLFDPHAPYAPPEPFRTRYAARPYDGEVAYADAALGELVAELEAGGFLERTVVLLVSDHGEGLGAHDEDEHGLLAYDTTLRVPWILRLPNRRAAGLTIDRPVGLVDVYPTLLELFGIASSVQTDGRSLVPSLEAGLKTRPTTEQAAAADVVYGESYYPRLRFGWSELLTVRTDRFKYIRAPRPELYEYRRDPAETRNVIAQHRDVAARLDGVLARIVQAGSGKPSTDAVDPEVERRLRTLGYVGGSAGQDLSSGEALPDPKDKVAAYRKLMRAREMLATGREEAGVAALEELLVEEPGMDQAHRSLREYWIARGEFQTAIERLRAAGNARPDDPRLGEDLAVVYRASLRLDAALDVITRVLQKHPDRVEALMLAGEILQDRRSHARALEHFTRAAGASGGSATANVRAAQSLFHLDRFGEAEERLARSLQEDPRVAGAHYLLAQIAERRGDASRAEAEYRLEIDPHPWDYQARFNLAALVARRGAHREQIALLDSIPPIAPKFHEVHFYRAKAYLDSGEPARLADAIAAAREGLRLAPESSSAPLGHYVLADVYQLQGRRDEAMRELSRGRALEERLSRMAR